MKVFLHLRIIGEAEPIPIVDVIDVAEHARVPLTAAVVHGWPITTVVGGQIVRIDELVDLAHVATMEEDLIRWPSVRW